MNLVVPLRLLGEKGKGPAALVLAVLILVLVSGVGCGGTSGDHISGGGSGFTESDSAGVRISVTAESVAYADIDWEVDPEPSLILGAGAAPGDFLFQVKGVRGLSTGGTAVVTAGEQELRVYGPTGSLENRVGGRGEGPGEFLEPVLVPTVGYDSLVVFDKALRRVQVFSLEGELLRLVEQARPWPYGRREPGGGVGAHTILRLEGEIEGGGGEAPLLPGVTRVAFQAVWYNLESGEETVIESFPMRGLYFEGKWPLPFTVPPQIAAAGDGVFVTGALYPEIRKYDLAGRLLRILRIPGHGRSVTSEQLRDLAEVMSLSSRSLSPSDWSSRFREGPVPETMPFFGSLKVDELGWLWAEVYGWNPKFPTEWVVFDPRGRARGMVKTPPGLQVEWIGRDAIWGLWVDELGVEYVHRHSVERDPSGRIVS